MADNSKNKKPVPKKAKDEAEDDEIFTAPVITREPVSKQVYLGQKISLRITATGKPVPSFQWYLNGRKISGATSDRFMVNKSRRDQAGAYTCEAKNFVGSTMSRAAMITFLTMKVPELKIVFSSNSNAVAAGSSCKISVVSPTPDVLKKFEFRWLFNGRRIKDAHEHELIFTNFKPKYSGEYKLMVIHGGELYSSNLIKLSCLAKEAESISSPALEQKEELSPSPQEAAPMETKDSFFFDPLADGPMEEVITPTNEVGSEPFNLVEESPSEAAVVPKNFERKNTKVLLLEKLLRKLLERRNQRLLKAS